MHLFYSLHYCNKRVQVFFFKCRTDQCFYEYYSMKQFPAQSFGSSLTLRLNASSISHIQSILFGYFIVFFFILYRNANENRITRSWILPEARWDHSRNHEPQTVVTRRGMSYGPLEGCLRGQERVCSVECFDFWKVANDIYRRSGESSECETEVNVIGEHGRPGGLNIRKQPVLE